MEPRIQYAQTKDGVKVLCEEAVDVPQASLG